MDYEAWKSDRSGGIGCTVYVVCEIVRMAIHKEKCGRVMAKNTRNRTGINGFIADNMVYYFGRYRLKMV